MWPIKEKENRQLLIEWPNLNRYTKLQEYVVAVLLLKSTPLLCPFCLGYKKRQRCRDIHHKNGCSHKKCEQKTMSANILTDQPGTLSNSGTS